MYVERSRSRDDPPSTPGAPSMSWGSSHHASQLPLPPSSSTSSDGPASRDVVIVADFSELHYLADENWNFSAMHPLNHIPLSLMEEKALWQYTRYVYSNQVDTYMFDQLLSGIAERVEERWQISISPDDLDLRREEAKAKEPGDCYLLFRDIAANQDGTGWKMKNDALFVRLDSFRDRCRDALDFTRTVIQFSKLERVEIGGTKGKVLSDCVVAIREEFMKCVETFKGVSYDIMDVGEVQFEHDYFKFRMTVKDLDRVVEIMKGNLRSISGILSQWCKEPIISRAKGSKPMALDEFDLKHKERVGMRTLIQYRLGLMTLDELADLAVFKHGGKEIHKFVKDSSEALKVSKVAANWKAYVDFVNNIVIEGFVSSIAVSLQHLCEILDPLIIAKHEMLPLFEVKIELQDSKIIFDPPFQFLQEGARDLVEGFEEEGLSFRDIMDRIKVDIGRQIPALEEFDKEILKFKSLKADLSNMKTPVDIHWLRVGAQPVKLALVSFARQWEEKYVDFLKNF
eukprot:s5473_g4.t1